MFGFNNHDLVIGTQVLALGYCVPLASWHGGLLLMRYLPRALLFSKKTPWAKPSSSNAR